MKKFFDDLNSLHRFIRNIDLQRDKLRCRHCSKGEHFVAHDFIYKKQNNGLKKIVGRRIFCSNRYGRTGCGATYRLYLATIVPTFKFTSPNISRFIKSLLDNNSIQKAYKEATGSEDPRNAYRWLNKLYRTLTSYRAAINRFNHDANQRVYQTKRFKILLPTFCHLFNATDFSSCTRYQLLRQKCFI